MQYAKLGDSLLESLQGLTTLKIYQSDGHIHEKINEESERFRRITMKVLTMQLILMDIMMPNMNGWNAAQMIRSMKRSDSAAVPIIAMSANSFADDIINSCISGINENLSKPIDDKALLNTIKKFIANRNSAL